MDRVDDVDWLAPQQELPSEGRSVELSSGNVHARIVTQERALERAGRAVAACDDDAVLLSVTLGIALSVFAAACALVEPPAPRGRTWFRLRS